jgi:hypothetical protein
LDDMPAPGLPEDSTEHPADETAPAEPAVLADMAGDLATQERAEHPVEGEPTPPSPAGAANRLGRTFGRGRTPGSRPNSDWRRLHRAATASVFAVALVLCFSGAAPLTSIPPSGPSGSPIAAASVAAPSVAPAASPTPAPSVTPVASPPLAPSMTATASPTETATALATPSQTSPTARIKFTAVMLDSTTDPTASPRTFTFTSDGPGIVSAQIVATSPTETTKLCIAADGASPDCSSGATPGFTKPVFTAHSSWTVTLASANAGTPTVDLAISWPAGHPSLHFEGARFQGAPNPDSLRSLVVTFGARAGGQLSFTAAWPPATVDATLSLADASGSQPIPVAAVSFPAAGSIATAYTHPVVAGRTYMVTLYDAGYDQARPRLSATIAFP